MATWFVKVFEEGVGSDPNVFHGRGSIFSSSEIALLVSGLSCLAHGQLLQN